LKERSEQKPCTRRLTAAREGWRLSRAPKKLSFFFSPVNLFANCLFSMLDNQFTPIYHFVKKGTILICFTI